MNDLSTKKFKELLCRLNGMNKHARFIIRFGAHFSIALLAVGAVTFVYNRTAIHDNSLLELISTNLIIYSFSVLAEFIIAGVILDYLTKKE